MWGRSAGLLDRTSFGSIIAFIRSAVAGDRFSGDAACCDRACVEVAGFALRLTGPSTAVGEAFMEKAALRIRFAFPRLPIGAGMLRSRAALLRTSGAGFAASCPGDAEGESDLATEVRFKRLDRRFMATP